MRQFERKGAWPLPPRNSLEDDARLGVEALADFVVGGEGEHPGAAAGPHRAAVQRVRRLAQTHDGRAGHAHGQSLYRLPVLLLRRRRDNRSRMIRTR